MRNCFLMVCGWTVLLLAGWARIGWSAEPRSVTIAQSVPQPAAATSPAEADSGATRPSTRQLEKRYHRGRELLEEGEYLEGTRLLQSILESPEDDFFQLDGKGDNPTSKVRDHSLKFESQLLLGGMPAAGRAIYESQYGPVARRMLSDALVQNDVDQIGQVARRFFHTQAGIEAAYRLASDYLDHGHPLTAALCFERLRQTAQAALAFEPLLSIKTALSWQRAGRNEKAADVLTQLRKKHPRPTVAFGGREIPFFQEDNKALEWLVSTLGGGPPGSDDPAGRGWTMVRGDSRRNAESAGESPYLNRGWRASTVEGTTPSSEKDAVLARMLRERHKVNSGGDDDAAVPMLPSFQPLVVDDLVIVRGIGDLRAYELATGKLAWAASEKDQLLVEMLRAPGNTATQNPAAMSPLAILVAQRAWDDTTFGTISSDGERVFAVEDLGLSGRLQHLSPRFHSSRDHNRLAAYDARTGKALWEAGGPRGAAADELAGSFFLGAPLVLDRRLYALVESGSDVRLVVLEPGNGRLLWSQTLNSASDNAWDAHRRQSGLSPSYEGGILVCPIGAEQVTAVELTGRSLLWRYRFRDASEAFEPRLQQLLLGPQPARGPVAVNAGIDQNRWLDSTAIIGEARIILSPRESNELFCLNLTDGTLAWKSPRGDGLIVAGIHEGKVVIVGRSFVQALRLADGRPAWSEPPTVPLPSGRGFVGEGRYHLPLSTGEVATIELSTGRIVSRSRSLKERVPGNLVAVAEAVISQGGDFVEAYKPLAALEAEIADRLAENEDDSEALTLRGEIRLQRGEVHDAYADLQRALELRSDDAAVRELLIGSLLEGLRVDFATYRRLPVDIDRLLSAPEQRSAYLWLQATGLQRTGEVPAAFEALLQFADPSVSDREFDRIDALLTVRRDRLVRARARQLHAAASVLDRAALDEAWRARSRQLLADGDAAAIHRFVDYFGGLTDEHELERKMLLEETPNDWLAHEFLLRRFDASTDPAVAATATARLVKLLLSAERPRDAALLFPKIERQSPETVLLDGRVGRDLVAEWKERSDVRRATPPDPSWPTGRVEIEREPSVGNSAQFVRSFPIPVEGDRDPFFTDLSLEISSSGQNFVARDTIGRAVWKINLDVPIPNANFQYNRAYARDHLLVLAIGMQVIAIDTLGTAEHPGARILWRMNLNESAGSGAIVPQNARNRRRMPFVQMELLGAVGPVTRNYLAVLRGRKLLALDPLTGKPLWIREGITPGSELFGDEELLFIVPPESTSAEVFRALDGESLGFHPLPAIPVRLETTGRVAILWQKTDKGHVLSALDVAAERSLWQRDFPDSAWIGLIDGIEAFVIQADGQVTFLSLKDGADQHRSTIAPPAHLQSAVALRSRDQYVLIVNQRQEPEVMGMGRFVNPMPHHLPINGIVYGFDRKSGRKPWSQPISLQALDPFQPSGLPILTFAAHLANAQRNNAARSSEFNILCLDKRTGRIVHRDEQAQEWSSIDYTVDVDQHQVELRLFKSTIRLTFTDKSWPEKP